MPLIPGEIIDGKYRIVRLLGEGGMGAVYEGENQRINRRVAIKVLHEATAARATAVRRFEQEARAAGLIGSEHIVEVLDVGSLPNGDSYMVMEFLEGETLAARIKRAKRLTPHEATPLVTQLLDGLAAAHKAGIIHRDLKPDNVFLVRSLAGKRDFVKVVDFGVSKFSALETEGMNMTNTGAVVGTPYYLSPEQARGVRQLDARSDLYSVGVLLYQAVTGRLPFHAETFNELVFKIALESPEPAEVVVPGLDPAFAAIIARAMTRDVNGRFQTAEEFHDALTQWLEERPDPSAEPAPRRSGAATPPSQPSPMATTLPAPPAASPAAGPSGGVIPGALRPSGGTVPLPVGDTPASGPSPLPRSTEPTPVAVSAAPEVKKKGGSLVLIAAVILVSAVGGALGAYKLSSSGAQNPATPQAIGSGLAEADAAASNSAAPPSALPAPSNIPTAASPTSASPLDTSTPKPEASASIAGAPVSSIKKPVAAPTPTPTATTKPTGRVIGGEL